jgi:N-ethylmaleimide reductase
MSHLLKPYARLNLPNRIVMAPMTRGRSDDATGVPGPLTAAYYAQRASAGLIVSEGAWVSPTGKGGPGIPGIATAEHVAAWREVTDAVHAAGGRIFAQLWHVGRISHSAVLGHAPVAPSAVRMTTFQIFTNEGLLPHEEPRELTADEIRSTVRDFASAARNAIDAGFDGVEIHGANGYLIEQFLAENTNLRTDEYGGSLAGRLRFPLEVVHAVVAEVGAARVGLRISPDSPVAEIGAADAQETYRALVDALDPLGLAYLHVVQAGGYNAIADLRPRWSGTLIGNFNGPVPTTQQAGEDVLEAGHADLIAYGRLFISNPDLPERFAAGLEPEPAPTANIYGGGAEGYVDYPALQTV